MAERLRWLIVDDQLDDVAAFAAAFQEVCPEFDWEPMLASEAQALLLGKVKEPIAGALIDVDLSSDGKMEGTGLGLAQNVRARQKKGDQELLDFPVMRFANPDPVAEYVGDDPASDDLFDLLISKVLARSDPQRVVAHANAVFELYRDLSQRAPTNIDEFSGLLGVSPEEFGTWGDERLWKKVRVGLGDQAAKHVAAGTLIRSFLHPAGLLISEELLAVRLGIDRAKSKSWRDVLSFFEGCRYAGTGASGFVRWWSRGVDAHWASIDQDYYLHERTSDQRVSILTEKLGFALEPLSPPKKYWRLCAVSAWQNESRPIDPREAIGIVSAVAREPWLEPEQVDLEVAAMHRDNPRVDADELASRLK